MSGKVPDLEFHPVTPYRWPDLEKLFQEAEPAPGGNPRGCWCMEWRLPRAQWKAQSGEGNRRAMKGLVNSREVPGILAYRGSEVVGWCSVSPRRGLVGLKEIGSFEGFENPGIWSIVCFYVPDHNRGEGIMSALLRSAVEFAEQNGAKIVEGYPLTEPAFMGSVSAFNKAGFEQVGSPQFRPPYSKFAERQSVMRYYIEPET